MSYHYQQQEDDDLRFHMACIAEQIQQDIESGEGLNDDRDLHRGWAEEVVSRHLALHNISDEAIYEQLCEKIPMEEIDRWLGRNRKQEEIWAKEQDIFWGTGMRQSDFL